jgi:hypothetical protein
MVLFVLKGGGCSLRSTIRNNKNRKHFKLGRDEKLTRDWHSGVKLSGVDRQYHSKIL